MFCLFCFVFFLSSIVVILCCLLCCFHFLLFMINPAGFSLSFGCFVVSYFLRDSSLSRLCFAFFVLYFCVWHYSDLFVVYYHFLLLMINPAGINMLWPWWLVVFYSKLSSFFSWIKPIQSKVQMYYCYLNSLDFRKQATCRWELQNSVGLGYGCLGHRVAQIKHSFIEPEWNWTLIETEESVVSSSNSLGWDRGEWNFVGRGEVGVSAKIHQERWQLSGIQRG